MNRKEKPIIFSSDMVRAILKGRKTQTRRVIKPPFEIHANGYITKMKGNERLYPYTCPYGKPGDDLWVRETFAPLCKKADPHCWCETEEKKKENHFYQYKADTYRELRGEGKYDRYPGNWDDALTAGQTHHPKEADHIPRWKASIHMPRKASRIQLTVVDIRVQRIQEIIASDCVKEGIAEWKDPGRQRSEFCELWNSINAKRGFGWESNPYVWVVKFKVKCKKESIKL